MGTRYPCSVCGKIVLAVVRPRGADPADLLYRVHRDYSGDAAGADGKAPQCAGSRRVVTTESVHLEPRAQYSSHGKRQGKAADEEVRAAEPGGGEGGGGLPP